MGGFKHFIYIFMLTFEADALPKDGNSERVDTFSSIHSRIAGIQSQLSEHILLIETHAQTNKQQAQTIRNLEGVILNQNKKIALLEKAITGDGNTAKRGELHLEERLQNMEQIIAQQMKHHGELEETMRMQAEEIHRQNESINTLENTVTSPCPDQTPRRNEELDAGVVVERNEVGCFMDTLTLSCINGGYIYVTRALYGQYYNTCAECCVPGTNDCTELVHENSPADWVSLKLECDNRTACSYVYEGAIINDCEPQYVADYMQVFYQCLQEEIKPIGFTAYATETRNFTQGETIIFDQVLTNLGEHYWQQNSTFRCPVRGVYLFTLAFNAQREANMYAQLVQDGTVLVEAWADDDELVLTHASAFALVECEAGQAVWARSRSGGVMYGMYQRSHFSGYLLHRF